MMSTAKKPVAGRSFGGLTSKYGWIDDDRSETEGDWSMMGDPYKLFLESFA